MAMDSSLLTRDKNEDGRLRMILNTSHPKGKDQYLCLWYRVRKGQLKVRISLHWTLLNLLIKIVLYSASNLSTSKLQKLTTLYKEITYDFVELVRGHNMPFTWYELTQLFFFFILGHWVRNSLWFRLKINIGHFKALKISQCIANFLY